MACKLSLFTRYLVKNIWCVSATKKKKQEFESIIKPEHLFYVTLPFLLLIIFRSILIFFQVDILHQNPILISNAPKLPTMGWIFAKGQHTNTSKMVLIYIYIKLFMQTEPHHNVLLIWQRPSSTYFGFYWVSVRNI